jgi:hypothetical protein
VHASHAVSAIKMRTQIKNCKRLIRKRTTYSTVTPYDWS